MALHPYERLKLYRAKESLKRERLYLDQPLGPGEYYRMTGRQRASRKRWVRYYRIRRLERLLDIHPQESPRAGTELSFTVLPWVTRQK